MASVCGIGVENVVLHVGLAKENAYGDDHHDDDHHA
jgi:hypothetical protein